MVKRNGSLFIALLFLFAFPVLVLHFLPPLLQDSRAMERAVRKKELMEIGHAIRLYREKHGVNPRGFKDLLFDGERRYVRKDYPLTYPDLVLQIDANGFLCGASFKDGIEIDFPPVVVKK